MSCVACVGKGASARIICALRTFLYLVGDRGLERLLAKNLEEGPGSGTPLGHSALDATNTSNVLKLITPSVVGNSE